jgi:hypothetical protein
MEAASNVVSNIRDDRMILPDVQRNIAKQLNATTISLVSSHASHVSHPNEIAKLILDATKGCNDGSK